MAMENCVTMVVMKCELPAFFPIIFNTWKKVADEFIFVTLS